MAIRKFGEGDPQPITQRFVDGDFVVAASEVLDDGVTGGYRLRGSETLESKPDEN